MLEEQLIFPCNCDELHVEVIIDLAKLALKLLKFEITRKIPLSTEIFHQF